MSAQSGVKVSDDLKTAFSAAVNDANNVRALVFIIEQETFKLHETVAPKTTFKDDMTLLAPVLPSPKTPASFAYRLDSKSAGKHEWMLITFVPDDAGVRAKMLQASSKPALMKALGANNFKHDWFATNIKDLSPSALTLHLNHLASPPPLSAREAALAEIREAEAQEAKRAALDPETEARRKRAVVGLGGKFQWGDGVDEALKKVAERSDDGWVVCLEIPSGTPGSISLLKSEACKPSELASKLPEKTPAYTFYSYPTPPPPAPAPSSVPQISSPSKQAEARNVFHGSQGGARPVLASNAPRMDEGSEEKAEALKDLTLKDAADTEATDKPDAEVEATPAEGQDDQPGSTKTEEPVSLEDTSTPTAPAASKSKGRILYIYTCPSASPIKFRMVYSSGVRGMQQDAADKAGVEVLAKLETSDISDLTASYLESSIPSGRPTHSASLPTPAKSSAGAFGGFGAPAPAAASSGGGAAQPAFGGAFGRPRPIGTKAATQIPLPASTGPSTPTGVTPGQGSTEGDDAAEGSVKSAFDAFGPRVGGGGGGFARPKGPRAGR